MFCPPNFELNLKIMKKLVFIIIILSITKAFSQLTNIYQPNGATTNFGKVASDSLNYYVVNYPALTLMKIDESNSSTLITTLTADPFQTMIWNNGKGIFPVASGSPFKLFDGTSQIDITGGQLPMAGYTLGNVIILDYFHIGNTTYFRTNDKIYKTDYSSPSSIITLATRQSTTGVGILDMSHTAHSIIYQNIVLTATGVLKRIDLGTGNITTIDSSILGATNYDKGIVYNNEYFYCTPFSAASLGNSKIFKISDSGIKTVFYTETNPTKYIRKVIGATPNGIIAVIADNTGANEYVSISFGVATSLNFGTFSNSFPTNDYAGGVTTSSLVYFSALDTNRAIAINKALWVTDGTLAGTRKIKGGSASTFNMSGLDQTLLGSTAFCGNDLYYEGRNGSIDGSLIYVNGTTFAMQAYNYLPNSVTMRQTASGILAIAKPTYTLSAKAVYKVNCSSVTGIEDNDINNGYYIVYPNPTNGILNIDSYVINKNCNIQILNSLGQIVFKDLLSIQHSKINISHFSSGIYFLNIIDSNGNKEIKKIIKD